MIKGRITKTLKIIVLLTVSLLICAIIVALLASPIKNTSNAEKEIKNEVNNGVKLSADRQNKIQGGFELISKERYHIELHTFNIFKPKYCLIYSSENENRVDVQVISMNRVGYNNLEIIDYEYASSRSITFDETIKLCSSQDIIGNDNFSTVRVDLNGPQSSNNNQLTNQDIEDDRLRAINNPNRNDIDIILNELPRMIREYNSRTFDNGEPMNDLSIQQYESSFKDIEQAIENWNNQNPQDTVEIPKIPK
jgi:hypothetical protein